jgi:competence protein ComEC
MKICSAFLCLLMVLSFTEALFGADTLEINVIDVEGGNAIIIQNPSGQSLLIDGGMPGSNDRDLKRIAAAAQAAGIKQFDVILITHYDVDHVGNIPAIFAQFPAKLLVDHGPLLPNPKLAAINRKAADAYVVFLPGKKRMSVKPGDTIPFKDVKISVVMSNEDVITKPLAGAGKPNPACPATLPEAIRGDDNAASIGTLWQFGKFRFGDFGDLLQWAEMRLMCPNNPVGTVDVLMIDQHGLGNSNSPAFIHGLAPKVVIANNGERKGIAPDVVKTLRSSPGIQDIWQSHFSTTAGADGNAPEQFLANMKQQECQGFSIKISARRDGSYTVTNARNNFSKTYKP